MTTLIDVFIDAIDARFFSNDSKIEVLKQLWEESKTENTNSMTCQSILQKGKRKGEACGKPCKSKFCPTHSKETKESKVILCKVLIKSGARKGQACDKKCVDEKEACLLHSKESKEKESKEKEPKENEPKEKEPKEKEPKEKEPKEKESKENESKEKKPKEKESKEKESMEKELMEKKEVSKEKKPKKTEQLSEEKQKKEKKPKQEKVKMCGTELKYGPNKGQACNNSCQKGTDACGDHQPIKIKRIGEHYIIKGTNVLFNMDNETAWGFIDSEKKIIRGKNEEVSRVCEQYNITFNYSYA
jgi:hypothetical protein